MKTSVKKIMALVMGIAFVGFAISWATAGSSSKKAPEVQTHTGFLGDYYKNLKPGKEGEATLRWIKPGIDFSKYKKVMVDYMVFALAEDAEYKGIHANEVKEIGDKGSQALINAIQDDFPVVSEPGPDVIRVRTAIINLKPNKPGLSAVSTVIPVGLGISILKKGATDSWAGSGATDVEMMVLDSMTNEVLACGQDHKTAGFGKRFSKWGSVEEAFDFWGHKFAKRLRNLIIKKK